MAGLSLVAVFAIAAVTATSASALPEWGKCVSQVGGKYTNSNCTTKGKGGSFEWKKGATLAPVKFSGENVGSGGVLETEWYVCGQLGIENVQQPRKACEAKEPEGWIPATHVSVECEHEENRGEAFGKSGLRQISVKFLGCKIFGSSPCSNGPNEGEIQVNGLKGSLGYISKTEKTVGVLLEPETKHGAFAQFNCAGIIGTVVGVGNAKSGAFYLPENKGGNDGIISPITPVNQMTGSYEQVYTTNGSETEPQNVPSKLEGKPIRVLEDYAYVPSFPEDKIEWSPAAEEITNVNHPNNPEEETEIKG